MIRFDQCCKCGTRTYKGQCVGCEFVESDEESVAVLAPDESWGDEVTDDNVRDIEAHRHSMIYASDFGGVDDE